MAGLLILTLLAGLGERLGERFFPIYLLALGGGVYAVGLLGFFQNLLSAFASYPAGWMADKWGGRKTLLFFTLLASAGYTLAAFANQWFLAVLGSVLFLSWSAVSTPAVLGVVSKVLPSKKRTLGVALHSLVRRVPMALGPVIAGLLMAAYGEKTGLRLSFLMALVCCGAGGLFLWLLLKSDDPQEEKAVGNPKSLFKMMDPRLKNLLLSDILIRFCEQIPYPFVVIWCLKTIAHPLSAPQFGALTAIEMATAFLIYLPIARLADQAGKRPFVLVTFVFFSAFPLFLYYSQSLGWLVAAFVLRGFKEFGEPARKALILDLSPSDQKSGMFGFYYLMRDSVVSLASLGGAFLWNIGPQYNLFVAFGFGLLGTLWFVMKGRDV